MSDPGSDGGIRSDWATKDFYAALGVGKTASADEIKKAYRKLARANHPDSHPDDTAKHEKFKQVADDVVGLGDLFEPVLRGLVARVAVGVVRSSQLPVGLLDRGLVGVLGHTEDLVEVLVGPVSIAAQRSPLLPGLVVSSHSGSSTVTFAARRTRSPMR